MEEGMCCSWILWFISNADTTKSWAPLSQGSCSFGGSCQDFLRGSWDYAPHLTRPRSAASKDETVIVRSPSALDFVPLETVWEDDVTNDC